MISKLMEIRNLQLTNTTISEILHYEAVRMGEINMVN